MTRLFYSHIRCIALHVCKLRMGFSVPSNIWVGPELMLITMQRTRPAWPAKTKLRMTVDCSRIAIWQEADIALFFQETRIRKIRKIFEENWSTIARNRAITSNEPWKTETNKVDRNAPITSKHLFPKRSAKMIDGTEKPKIPSKFAKHAARYNEFGHNKRNNKFAITPF